MLAAQPKPLAIVVLLTICAISLFLWTSGSTNLSDLQISKLSTGSSSDEVVILGDAHRIPTADGFWPHFQNVTRMRPVTMAKAKAGCHWYDTTNINWNFGEVSGWGVDLTWVTKEVHDSALKARRKQWQRFVMNDMLPYEQYASKFTGRGIVVTGGYGKSTERIKVILRQLNKLDSKLPMEIHHWKDEMTEQKKADLLQIRPNIYFQDLSAFDNVIQSEFIPKGKINFHLKINALLNSRFAELLLLDTDNIPAIDPERLFESLVYREYGSIFWPDISRTRINNPIWALTNTVCQMREWEQESGQLVVDKRRFWYHLQLASWMITGDVGRYYNNFILGDKDMFRFAWHALKTTYGRPKKWVTSVGYQNNGYFCGHSFGQYHPDNGQLAFLHGGTLKTLANEVVKWQREKNGGIFQMYKAQAMDEDHGYNGNVTLKFDSALYLPSDLKPMFNFKIGMCTDMYDVEARPLNELLPAFDARFDEIGGYWMLNEGGREIGSQWVPDTPQ